jgi:hypothetical protein
MADIAIKSIDLIDKSITIYFETSWFQEDMIELRQLILNKIPDHQVKEVIQGADRESIRFLGLKAEFILNFDYYSQSCWLNAHDEISAAKIQPLFNLITKT